LEAWLRKQPREVSVAFAARVALRVLPLLQTTEPDERYMRDIVLPSFRATAASWAAAKCPARETELAARAATAAFVAVGPNDVTALAANAAAQAVRAAATTDAFNAAARAAAYAVEAAARAADSGTGHSDGFNLKFAEASGVDPVTAAFWSAVSIDATQVEEGVAASVIAGSMLWPLHILQPEPLQSLWQDLKAALLAAKQDWQVWTIWFDDRVASYPRDEERELAYVHIEEALWHQGPANVNAEIRRRIEELEPPPPLAGTAAQPLSEILAAWQSADAAPQTPRPFSPPSIDTPHPGRQYDDNFLFIPVPLDAGGTPPAPIEAIPEQEPLATRFGVNSKGLIDLVLDPPAPETAADPLQREFYEEIRLKAQSLVAIGPNQLGDLSGPANRFCDGLKDRIEDISITSLWSRGNTLRIRLKAHDLSMGNEEPDPGRLHPLVAETLRDVVHTWNIFIVGDPKGRELDGIRHGPQDVEAAKRVVATAAPVVEALQHSENVATPTAIEAVVEQAETAKSAPAGIDGDQAIDLSRKTTGNFVAELLRSVIQGESAFAWKEYRAGIYRAGGTATAGGICYAAYNNWPAIVSFIAKNADTLKEFMTTAWQNPTLVEIIDWVVRTST
jgi:hypothetical protein